MQEGVWITTKINMRDIDQEIKRLKDQLCGSSKQRQKEINKRIAKLKRKKKSI